MITGIGFGPKAVIAMYVKTPYAENLLPYAGSPLQGLPSHAGS
jgi:hypothetical protein